MLSLSSIACKNNSTNNDSPPPDTFTATESTENVKTLIVKQASEGFSGNTLKIAFTSDKGFTTALTSAKTNNADIVFEDGVTLSSLYDSSTGALTITNKDLTNTTSTLKDADITISLVFTLTANDSSLQNATQTKNVDITIKKTTYAKGVIIGQAMAGLTHADANDERTVWFNLATDLDGSTSYSDEKNEVQFLDKGSEASAKLSKAAFKTKIETVINSDSVFTNYFEKISLEAEQASSAIMPYKATFTPKSPYEMESGFTYTMKFNLGKGNWTD